MPLLLAAPLVTQAQDTEQVSVPRQGVPGREEYSVLKTDSNIRQGAYRSYAGRKGTTLVTEGFYVAGQPDSTWTAYADNGKNLLWKGRYHQGQKAGVWNYYSAEGKLVQQYDHSSGKLVLSTPTAYSMRATFWPSGAEAYTTPPVYIGGESVVLMHIGRSVRYPAEALRSQIMGDVRVAFTIDKDGNASNYRVVQGLGYGCDEEALRVVKLLPSNWIPASANGKPVAAECQLPVSYRIL
ncbi:TonB family protein [Hymenobacter chitinivorans DSM 11115]|uniref:TonB family protein n=2 Tax=Hymenobacter chitinivorans TaxID=89969 RepID=A0A2M9B953_9BACT|nr:TonB family protein [Hymenobacter chitinivorans DSM 11115]